MVVSVPSPGIVVDETLTPTLWLADIVQRPYMKPWFEWIVYIDPLSYTVEALLATELHGRTFPCEDYNIVPFGPEYAGLPSSCSGIPAASGNFVNGDDYLSFLSYSHGNVWRNFGIIWAWWALFVGISRSSWATSFGRFG